MAYPPQKTGGAADFAYFSWAESQFSTKCGISEAPSNRAQSER